MTMEAGRKLIVQIHYNTTNGALPDQTAISIKTNANAAPVKWLMLTTGALNLTPGQPDVFSTATLNNQTMLTVDHLFETSGGGTSSSSGTSSSNLAASLQAGLSTPIARQMKIYGVGPHMHKLGRHLKLEMVDWAGKNTCMANVPLFDFNWQMGSLFKKPLTLGVTSSVKLTCGYDTTGRTQTVTFGEGTNDEMCISFLLVTAK